MMGLLLIMALWTNPSWDNRQARPEGFTIFVEVVNLRSSEGLVHVALHDSRETYLKVPYRSCSVEVNGEKHVVARFEGVAPGTFAVTAIHDENSNHKLDKNIIGIPKEDYGFSKNARGLFGPAKFEEAAFTLLDSDIRLVIKMTTIR